MPLDCFTYLPVKFYNYASEISAVVQENAQNTLDALESFSSTVTSFAAATNSTWPFVTIPDFPSRAHRLTKLAKAKSVVFAPMVNNLEERTKWRNFTSKTFPKIFQEGLNFDDSFPDLQVEDVLTRASPDIFRMDWDAFVPSIEDRPGPWIPLYQIYPLLINGALALQQIDKFSSACTVLII